MSSTASVTAGRNNGKRGRPLGYAAWNPRGATLEVVEAAQGVIDDYSDQLPLTIRQIYYALVARSVIDKDDRSYERLGNYLNRARRARMIAFEHIRDDGISVWESPSYAGIEAFQDEYARRVRAYQRDRLEGQPVRIEIWCEAAGMIPQIGRVAERYSVPVYSAGGFSSTTGTHSLAQRAARLSVPLVVLHVGDFDPSGVSIYERIVSDAAAFTIADRSVHTAAVEGVRVALTAEQVSEFDLPTKAAKVTDSRTSGWNGQGTCELEAVPPDQLAAMVRDAIETPIDADQFWRVVELEQDDREQLLALGSGDPQ